MNKYIKNQIETRLIDFGNNKILKSNRVECNLNYYELIQPNDFIFVDEDNTFIVTAYYDIYGKDEYFDQREMFEKTYAKYPNAKIVGECICQYNSIPGEMPKVVGFGHPKIYAGKIYAEVMTLHYVYISSDVDFRKKNIHINDDPNHMRNLDGWKNTEELSNLNIYNSVKELGPYYYIPSYREMDILLNYDISFIEQGTYYWTSSIISINNVVVFKNSSYLTMTPNYFLDCIPFLNIEYFKIKDYIE